MSEVPAIRRRFRFRLRTLLAVVTLAAVAAWSYWVVWPWWQIRKEQFEFESALTKFHPGANRADFGRLPLMWKQRFVMGSTWYDAEDGSSGDAIYWFQYVWPNCMYLVCFKYSNHAEGHEGTEYCVGVQVFRLPIPATNYRAITSRVRKHMAVNQNATDQYAYILDLLDMTADGHSISP